MKAGWKRLLKNEIGLHIRMKNANISSTVQQFLENQINAIKNRNKHRENGKSRLQIDEQCVQETSLIGEWDCDPSNLQQQSLRKLQAGAYATKALVDDFEAANAEEDLLIQESIKDRLFTKSKSIFAPYSKKKRKTFANFQNASNKKRVTTRIWKPRH